MKLPSRYTYHRDTDLTWWLSWEKHYKDRRASQPNSDTQTLVGMEPVLSRWHVAGCANCSTHLNVSTIISLPGWKHSDAANTSFDVLVHTKDHRFGRPSLHGKTPSVRLGNMLGPRS